MRRSGKSADALHIKFVLEEVNSQIIQKDNLVCHIIGSLADWRTSNLSESRVIASDHVLRGPIVHWLKLVRQCRIDSSWEWPLGYNDAHLSEAPLDSCILFLQYETNAHVVVSIGLDIQLLTIPRSWILQIRFETCSSWSIWMYSWRFNQIVFDPSLGATSYHVLFLWQQFAVPIQTFEYGSRLCMIKIDSYLRFCWIIYIPDTVHYRTKKYSSLISISIGGPICVYRSHTCWDRHSIAEMIWHFW
jgi:hypothetical protein